MAPDTMPRAELLLTNGVIRTGWPALPVTDALAVVDGRVACFGTVARVLADRRTTVLDLRGGLAVPGFVDAHIHLLWFGLGLESVALTDLASFAEVRRRIAERAATTPAGGWISGGGWNQDLWGGIRPTRHLLDAISRQHAMLFRRKDGHSIWVNSLALERAGVTNATPDPPGGRIERDAAGAPTGILAEEATALVARHLPQPNEADHDRAIVRATAMAHRAGITGIHDMEAADARTAFARAYKRGSLGLRVHMQIDLGAWRTGWPADQPTNSGDSLLRTGSLKLFADGALGSRTAAMLEPYIGQPSNLGVVVTPPEEVTALIEAAARQDVACAIHAIGDRANRFVLDAFAATRDVWAPRRLRQRIEHAQLLHADDLARFAALGVVASMQPIHATADRPIADRFWGARCRLAYAWRSVLDSGATLAFGSDCPVETLDVLQGLHAAVMRQGAGGDPAGDWYPEQRVTIAEALAAYTSGPAYAAGREAELGSLAPGKLADMTVLDRDFVIRPAEELLTTRVVATVVDGKVVYAGDG